MKLKVCQNKNCAKKFFSNGTKAYCDKTCYREAKNSRQAKLDSLIKEFRKGIYSNYKLFTVLLEGKGSVEIDLMQAKIKGFDINAYYGICYDDNKVSWCCVNEYYFKISNKNEKQILTLLKK